MAARLCPKTKMPSRQADRRSHRPAKLQYRWPASEHVISWPPRNGVTLTRPGVASRAWVDETILDRASRVQPWANTGVRKFIGRGGPPPEDSAENIDRQSTCGQTHARGRLRRLHGNRDSTRLNTVTRYGAFADSECLWNCNGATETVSPSCPLVHSGHGRFASLSGTVAVGAAQAVTKTAVAITRNRECNFDLRLLPWRVCLSH